ncbi:MAG: hypothetical protein M3Y39_06570 [Chloroflexota bacterium]|nr:hypothetical protein [Chloroflexota bacterium]
MRSLLARYSILCLRKPLSKDYGTSIICHMVEIKTKLAEGGRMQNSDTGSRNAKHWGISPEIETAIKRAQELVSQYIEQGRSLADELIAERRAEKEE